MQHTSPLRLALVALATLIVAPPARAAPADGVAVAYQVPVDTPTGEVQVLSLGAADLPTPGLIGSERHLHMRLAAHNQRDPRPWTLDPREQWLDLGDGRTLAPRFANPGGGAVVLRRGERGHLDLFFPVRDSFDPYWTSLTWRVRRDTGIIVARTVWERLVGDEDMYAHYRPAQFGGGVLVIGTAWCAPSWTGPWAGWLDPYTRYRGYHYRPRPLGFEVESDGQRWTYRREPGSDDSVGARWRGVRPGHAAPVVAPPTAAIAVPPTPPAETARWKWHVEHVDHRPPPEPPRESVGDSWRNRSSESSSSSLSSSSSSSSSSSTSSSSSDAPPSSPPSGDSVGSRWRSR